MKLTCQQKITELGWDVEYNYGAAKDHSTDTIRAFQGGFKTLWRKTPEECLKDVQAIVEARKQPENTPF